jgi:flagellar hook-associated protein 1
MSDLFTMLGIAARALDAQRFGLDVTGQNIANVNTPGYTRRSIDLAEVPPLDPQSPGGGVDVLGVRSARAPLIEARLRFEQPATAREQTIADHLAIVETGLGNAGTSLDALLTRFYNTYGALAQDPTSATARQQVVTEAQTLTRAFNDVAGRLGTAQRNADTELRASVSQVNELADQLADLNTAIIGAGEDHDVSALRDQQSLALGKLAQLIDIGVVQRQDGGIDVTIGNGRALVVGGQSYGLTATSTTAQGFASIFSSGADVQTNITSEITGGQIGGLIQVRDVLVSNYANQLDQLAYAVATDVNTLARSGYDVNGTAGTDFFVQPAATAGAARLMAVSSAVASDPRLVVAAAVPTPGNNDIAKSIAALQGVAIAGTATTPIDAWGNLLYRVATDSHTASQLQASHLDVQQQLEQLRNQISGVSLDEEAAMLIRFQRAYEANARFFSVVGDTLDQLLALVRA